MVVCAAICAATVKPVDSFSAVLAGVTVARTHGLDQTHVAVQLVLAFLICFAFLAVLDQSAGVIHPVVQMQVVTVIVNVNEPSADQRVHKCAWVFARIPTGFRDVVRVERGKVPVRRVVDCPEPQHTHMADGLRRLDFEQALEPHRLAIRRQRLMQFDPCHVLRPP